MIVISGGVMGAVDRNSLREALLDALADVEGVDRSAIDDAVTARGGDLMFVLDSKVAECVIAALEVVFDAQLPGPAELDCMHYSTVAALLDLLSHKLLETES